VAGYSGDAGDGLLNPSWSVNGLMFSTLDSNNGLCGGYNCAGPAGDGGAWWFGCCSVSNINFDTAGYWTGGTSLTYNVPASRMLVKIT